MINDKVLNEYLDVIKEREDDQVKYCRLIAKNERLKKMITELLHIIV